MSANEKKAVAKIKLLQSQGHDIDLEWGYGQPRCTNKAQSVDLGPRLPAREMLTFLDGVRLGLQLAEAKGEK